MTATAPPLEADLVAGLKRLQLAHFRAVAAETLQTAMTQRWRLGSIFCWSAFFGPRSPSIPIW